MRIGAFSEQFSLSPETIRYYVNKGLLCPMIKNDRYDFKENDIDDMQLLLRLLQIFHCGNTSAAFASQAQWFRQPQRAK